MVTFKNYVDTLYIKKNIIYGARAETLQQISKRYNIGLPLFHTTFIHCNKNKQRMK